MDRERKKKIAASISAILHFESERVVLAAAEPARPVSPAAAIPLWSSAGRQEQMSMRAMLQRRFIKSW